MTTTDERAQRALERWIDRHPRTVIAAVRAELRKPCRHGIPRDQPCRACAEEVPF